jgi:hypothetical protein
MIVGCGSEEEKPNPLEKADVPLPVVTMPTGHFPSKLEKSSRPILKEKPIAGTEIAVEGLMEVADPETFRPEKMFVKFIVETKKHGDVTAGTHRGGIPIRTQGNQYQYRNAIEVPPKPRRYVLEVYQGKELVSAAHIEVEEAKK